MEAYLADDALSGSKFFNLLTEAGLLTWESSANPLWEDEDDSTKGQLRGSACHAAVLEGFEAYEAGFCVAPEGVLKSGTDMEGWLKRAKASGREDMAAIKTSGKVGELRVRIEEARKLIAEDDTLYPLFWDEKVGGRRVLTSQDDAYVRLIARFIRMNPKLAPYLNEGLAEVTIVLTIEGVRYKCRLDYMTAACDLDLKSYGRGPNIDQTLKRHLIRGAFYNGAHLQAVHNSRMTMLAGSLYRAGKLSVHSRVDLSDEDQARLEKAIGDGDTLRAIFAAREKTPAIWRWLFVRMDGPPATMLVPFRVSDGMWSRALEDIEHAVGIFRDYTATCEPGELWFTDHGEQEIDDVDWPLSAWEGRL